MAIEPVTFAAGKLRLEGALHLPEGAPPFPGVAVCHPHPLYGGDMHNSVVVAVCEALVAGGIAALRFNFRGTGESEGSFGGGLDEQQDARAALGFLAKWPSLRAGALGLAGYSFGAIVALSTIDERVRALAAVSPPLAMGGTSPLPRCPTLFVFGDRDGIAPASGLSAVAPQSFAEQEIIVVPGADHFWSGKAGVAAAHVADFFRRRLLSADAGDAGTGAI
ncbi:MAG: CocE/NonD family hydrolase [Dehalococcoidia bacterium]|nr:CocE/NonD family hydrolase [Dehalococcoidia bacterium]